MTDQLTPETAEPVGSGLPPIAVRHDLDHVPLVDPHDKGRLVAVFNHRYLLSLMVKRELRARYVGSKMGLAWSYINPLSRFLTFYFVFGIILGRGQIPHFAIHLFAGMVVVNLFTESFNSGTRSIMQNKSIVQKMPLPREIFPIASMLVTLWHTGPQLVILVGAGLVSGYFVPDLWVPVAAAMAFTIVILLGTAMGLMFSAINVMYRDWTRVVQIFTNMVPFSVPMMYPFTLVDKRFQNFPLIEHFYLFNPVAEAVLLMQRAFWITTISPHDAKSAGKLYGFKPGLNVNFPPHLIERGAIMIGVCLLFLCFAQWVFTHFDDRIPDRLI